MRTCRVCGKLSATNKDHDSCAEKRRLELAEAQNAGEQDSGSELGPELGALLGHIASERD